MEKVCIHMALQDFHECRREEFYMINILYRLNGKKAINHP